MRLLLVFSVAVAGCEDPAYRSVTLGDRLLAVGDTEEAIAEYKLAQRLRGETNELLLRLGHAYALGGDVNEALGYFERLVERDAGARHQVASDLVALAVEAQGRGAIENMVGSLEPIMAWGFGYVPPDLQRSLAVGYANEGDYIQALSLYLALLEDETKPALEDLYRTGRAYKELGGCDRALPYLEQYVDQAGRSDENRDAARWHYGDCLFLSADADRTTGRPDEALGKLDKMVDLGVPRSYMDEAHFFRGEMMLSSGNTEEALLAYALVLELNPTRTGSLVHRAEERIRQIRFGFD
jgi:tetratricopeptide (TPR) repeat protein